MVLKRIKEMHVHIAGKINKKVLTFIKEKVETSSAPNTESSPPRFTNYTHRRPKESMGRLQP